MIENGGRIHEDSSRVTLAEYAAASNKSKQWPQYLAAILATLGAFSAGTCLSWSSPALPMLLEGGAAGGWGNGGLRVTPEQGSWIGAFVTLGAFAGAIPAGMLANAIGRKRTLQALCIPMLASWMLIAYSLSVSGLMAARFLAGIAVGAFSVAIPMYVAELAEPKIRGTLGTLFQLQITAGILFEYLIGMIPDLKLIALTSSAIPVIFFISFSCMPESPVYLCNKGHQAAARASLQWLRGADYDVEDEITRIQDRVVEDRSNKISVMDLVRSQAATRGMTIALGLMIFQQLSGINAVIFYTQSIFEGAGSSLPPSAPAIIVGIVMVVSTYISTILVDRAGRRKLLQLSSVVMSICLVILSAYFIMMEQKIAKLPFLVPLLCVAVYIIVFSLGFGPIPWMMLGELFSPKLKGAASSVSAAFNWILAFTVTKCFQNMVDLVGTGQTFTLFAVVCFFANLFVIYFVPETKGKDMEEILRILGGEEEEPKKTEFETNSGEVDIDVKK